MVPPSCHFSLIIRAIANLGSVFIVRINWATVSNVSICQKWVWKKGDKKNMSLHSWQQGGTLHQGKSPEAFFLTPKRTPLPCVLQCVYTVSDCGVYGCQTDFLTCEVFSSILYHVTQVSACRLAGIHVHIKVWYSDIFVMGLSLFMLREM